MQILQILNQYRYDIPLFIIIQNDLNMFDCRFLFSFLINQNLQLIITNMITKAVGYAGFQSYGDLPFSTLKPGKEQQKDDQVWSSTLRTKDHKPHLENYHHMKTVYRKDYLQNTIPADYEVDLVKKGSTGFDKFSASNSIKTHEILESSAINKSQNPTAGPRGSLLKSGVQHWRSNYQKDNDDVDKYRNEFSRSLANGFGNTGNSKSNFTNQNNNKTNDQLDNLTNNPVARSSSAYKPNNTTSLFRPEVPAWSKHSKAFSNKTPSGVTQYKFIYGERIGHEPKPHIMDEFSQKQPNLYNPLKAGTTQLVEHIPGYQGFLPASKTFGRAFEHGKGENTRTTFLKSNLIENYHVEIPGYSGFQTKSNFVSNDKLRSSCFRSNEFAKN